MASNVQSQIRQMIAFIDQEAKEKAEEIRVQAEQQARHTMSTLIHEEKLRLDKEYAKKEQKLELEQGIQRSMVKRQGQLRMLADRDQLKDQLKDDTLEALRKSCHGQGYQEFMVNCAVEATLTIDEPVVELMCTSQDKQIVQDSLQSMTALFEKIAAQDGYRGQNKKVKLSVNTNRFLSAKDAIGGVVATALNGRIRVNNSIATRLNISMHDLLPRINNMLYPKK